MLTITPAAPADIDDIAAMFAGAYREDPPTLSILGAPADDVEKRMFHLFRAIMNSGPLNAGTIDVAREDGRILGAAVWHEPGSRGETLRNRLRNLPDYLRAFGLRGAFRARSIQKEVDSYRPTRPHWYLHVIGVSPLSQGRSVGSLMLHNRLTAADEAGESVYLESSTPETGRLYRRYGFETLRRVSAFPEAAPHAMWRPPAGAQELVRG